MTISPDYRVLEKLTSSRGRLYVRLTALMLVTAVPILVIGVMLVGSRALAVIEEKEIDRLGALNHSLAGSISVWLNINTGALESLVAQSEIVGMKPEEQEPLLEAMETVYASMYLVSTTDLNGFNVARSDEVDLKDYSDRSWFQQVRDGAPIAFEIVIGRTSGLPALVVAMPIRGASGGLVGVGMFASTLDEIAEQVSASQSGVTGYAYVVDKDNRILIHSDPAVMVNLEDFSAKAPIAALRRGEKGVVKFTVEDGARRWAYVDDLENGWGIVVQLPEDEVLSSERQFQMIYWAVVVVGALVLSAIGFFTMRRAFRPISSLTETANAIAQGDLTRIAPVEREDEIGVLAQAFNSMTAQLNDTIMTLEERVAERTRELERRADYLATTGHVSRVVASILDVDEVLNRVTNLISERFGFYHTGIFLIDESGAWVVLRSVSSEAGQRMLARGYRLGVGQQGIVGYVSGSGRPRISLDVDEDTAWAEAENPDLPETRSEMALPLIVGEQVIGVLDVQSKESGAFSTEDVETLRILADQVAIAIQNARMFQSNERALAELQRVYGEAGRRAWAASLASLVGYRYRPSGTKVIRSVAEIPAEDVESTQVTKANTLVAPLRLIGGTIFGALRLQRDPAQPWTAQEIQFVQLAAQDIAQALEVARLLDETRSRAARDRLVGEVSARVRTSATDIDSVLQTTLSQLGQILKATGTIQISGVRDEMQSPSERTADSGQ